MKIINSLVRGSQPNITNSYGHEVGKRFSDIMLCKKFGWTPTDIANLPNDFYKDVILVLNAESDYQKLEQKKRNNKTNPK